MRLKGTRKELIAQFEMWHLEKWPMTMHSVTVILYMPLPIDNT